MRSAISLRKDYHIIISSLQLALQTVIKGHNSMLVLVFGCRLRCHGVGNVWPECSAGGISYITAEEGLRGWSWGHSGCCRHRWFLRHWKTYRQIWRLPAGLLWRRKWRVPVDLQGEVWFLAGYFGGMNARICIWSFKTKQKEALHVLM